MCSTIARSLRELLSTALAIGEPKESWSKLVVERRGPAKAVGVDIKRAIPIEMPRSWYWRLGGGCRAWHRVDIAGVHLLGNKAKKEEKEEGSAGTIDLRQAGPQGKCEELDKVLSKDDPELKKELGDQAKPQQNEPEAANKPEAVRTAEMKRLTDLNEKLAAMAKGEKGMQLDAMRDMMAQLKHPGSAELGDLYKNLAKGDFAKANQALNELKAKIGDKSLSPEEKKKLAEAMGKLAEQMKQNSDSAKDMAKAMEQAGVDPKEAAELAKQLAANPQMIAKAMEGLKNLTPEQKHNSPSRWVPRPPPPRVHRRWPRACRNALAAWNRAIRNLRMPRCRSSAPTLENEMLQQQAASLAAAMSECESQMEALGDCMGDSDCNGSGKGKGKGKGKGLAWNSQEGEWKEGDSSQGGTGNGKGGGPGRAAAIAAARC